MIAVAVFLAIGLACAIGAVFVLREASRQAAAPPPPTFSMDEAYEWVVANVDPLVAATLRPQDVRAILASQVEFFGRQGVTQADHAPNLAADVVIGTTETVEYVLARTAADGLELLPEQVYPVVETQLAYLQAIGAVGPRRTA
jgi:hypothetical protein